MEINEFLKRLKNLTKWDASIQSCGCCGDSVYLELSQDGNLIKIEELNFLIKEFENGNK